MAITLRPGRGAEIKLDMHKGDQVEFSWQSGGGAVNFDTHGDPVNAPKNFYYGYGKGRGGSVKGTLQTAFDGQHGWFWRNRGKADVSITLKTQGQYSAIKRVLWGPGQGVDEAQSVRIEPSLPGSARHELAHRAVRQKQAPQFLLDQSLRRAAQHRADRAHVRFELVEYVLNLPALVVQRRQLQRGRCFGVEAVA